MSQQKPGTIPGNSEHLIDREKTRKHGECYRGCVAQIPEQFTDVLDGSGIVFPAVVPELAG